jgi:hypothetical protein
MFVEFIEFMLSDSSKRIRSIMIKAMFLLFLSGFVASFNKNNLMVSACTFIPSFFMNIYLIISFAKEFRKFVNE